MLETRESSRMQQYDDGKDDRMSNPAAKHADEALRITLARRSSPKGCVHHSDHGAQYASLPLPKTMREHDVRLLTGPVSSPRGNAVARSLMGIARSECVHARRGGAGPFRARRGRLQPRADTYGAGRFEPRRVRGGQLAGGRGSPRGGVEAVNGIGVDSDSTCAILDTRAIPA